MLAVAVLAVAVLAVGCGESAPPSPPQPPEPATPAPQRIFIVTIDTLRADHLGLYGYPRPTSPFLDDLGARSVVFETAYASCSHTAPSHASLFTGLQPAQHRLLENGQPLPATIRTLAQVLAEKGYRTAGFSPVSFILGAASGFETMEHETAYRPASEIFGNALAWLRAQPDDEKLFVWVHLYDVHEWSHDRKVDEKTLRRIRQAGPSGEELLSQLEREHGLPADGRIPRSKVLSAVNRYDGQLLSVDSALRSFFETTSAEGLAADAVWAITSDHGEGLGNHDHLGHGKTIYEEQTHVPLVLYATDGRWQARRVAGLFRLVDVAPTLAEVAGTSFDQVLPLAGRSFLPVLRDSEHSWDVDSVYTQRRPADERRLGEGWTPGEVFALRTPQWKVIAKTEAAAEVYDMQADPFELRDLADDPSIQESDRLLRQLAHLYRQMTAESDHLATGEINPQFFDELKALGYL